MAGDGLHRLKIETGSPGSDADARNRGEDAQRQDDADDTQREGEKRRSLIDGRPRSLPA
jgi:hypothetical protein